MNIIKSSKHIISIPFIWAPLIPVAFAHLIISLYMNVCFRIYGIQLVRFMDYFSVDRSKLPYLSLIEKLNCLYCSYANAAFIYMAEVGQRTEYYWCGIKHRNQPNNPAFKYQDKFAKYGDENEYKQIRKKSGHDK